jgi:hypothetical protein
MPRFIPPPGPGRPKGSKSRRQLAVEAKLEELGCDPITAMATLAMDENTPLDLQIKLYCELAQYVVSRRKAVEQPIAIELPTLTSSKDAVTASAALLACPSRAASSNGRPSTSHRGASWLRSRPLSRCYASAALLAAVAAGEIAPGEAREVGRLLELHLKAVELNDIETRLAALEEKPA